MYEGDTGDDNDPDTESATVGENDPPEPEYAFVYLEVIRDLCALEHPTWDKTVIERQTVIHEIGHQFELGDELWGGCIMRESSNPALRTSNFCPNCLANIRATDSP